MEYMIEVHNLCKRYPDFALQNVSFQVPTGTIMGLIGENGAGKTTTLKAILGLLRPNSGEVMLLGKNPVQHRRTLNQDVAAVLDGSIFYEEMRAEDICSVMAQVHPRWNAAQFADYCKRFNIPMGKPIRDYSKGMRMKLTLSTALCRHPKLLVLDEPTGGLDPVVRSELLDIFWEFIQDEGHSILLSSHITTDLEKIADSITFLHKGQLVFSQNKDDLLAQYGIVKCSNADAEHLPGAHIVGRRENAFCVELLIDNKPTVQAKAPQLLVQPATIDDIITYYGKGGPVPCSACS